MTTPPTPDVPRNPDHLLEQYKAYLEDIGRIGERYESSKNFYITVISALFTFLALAGKEGGIFTLDKPFLWLVAGFGVGLCTIWIAHTHSVTVLFRFKFRILAEIEQEAKLHPAIAHESLWLFKPCSRPEGLQDLKYIPVTPINIRVAVLFIILFIALPFLKTVLEK